LVASPAIPCLAVTSSASVPNRAYASLMRAVNPRLQEGQSRVYATALLADSRAMHVDPTLVLALVTVESHWNARAVSVHGAEGLGQIKPGTARELGVDPWSGGSNLRGVTLYLHRLLRLFREARQPMREALAGYNAGPHAVQSYGGVPPLSQTRRYVTKVLATWHAMRSRLGNVARLALEPPLIRPAILDSERAYDDDNAAYWGAALPRSAMPSPG
jgi:soluble lytic murein transglycosylase-like protein